MSDENLEFHSGKNIIFSKSLTIGYVKLWDLLELIQVAHSFFQVLRFGEIHKTYVLS